MNIDKLDVFHNTIDHRFEAMVKNDIAVLEYRIFGNTISLDHTEVPVAFQGRGIAGKLAEAALKFARDHGYKVVPACTYVAAYLKQHPEWQDTLR